MPETADKISPIPSHHDTPSWPIYLFLIAVAVFLYSFLFELPATPFFGDADQSIFLYEAQRLFDGDIMYRDFFEFTMPGTQVLYALMFAIFGVKFWIISAATLIIGVLTTWLMLAISKRLLPSPLYFLPAVIFVFFGFRWFGFDGSHRMFSPVFILFAVWILMSGKNWRSLVTAGVSLGAASFFTQQRGLVVVVAILTFFLIEKFFRDEKWGLFFKSSAAICLSFGTTILALSAYFIAAAGPENFFYATVVYPIKYYGYGHPNNFGVYFIDLQKAFAISKLSDILVLGPVALYCIIMPFIIPLLLAIFVAKRRDVDWELWRGPILIALVGLFLVISITAPDRYRLFQISAPSLIILLWLVHRFAPSLKIKSRIAYVLIAGLMLLAAFQAIRVQTNWDIVHLNSPVGRLAMVRSKQAERYLWLAEHTAPGDYFFEVYEPFVYFPLGLKNPTRFSQIWPSEYTRPDQVAETVRDLAEKQPKYILWDNGYLTTERPRAAGDHTGPLADFVAASYTPIGEIYEIDGKAIQIWERRSH